MKNRSCSSSGLLAVGIVFFILGLLAILQAGIVMGFLSQILPNAEAIVIFGIIMQFIGQAFVISGVVRSTSNKFMTRIQSERQMTTASFNQAVQQMQIKWQSDKQALVDGFNQNVAKLESLIANQKSALASLPLPSSCKFCGAKISQGHFCPKCGKAN